MYEPMLKGACKNETNQCGNTELPLDLPLLKKKHIHRPFARRAKSIATAMYLPARVLLLVDSSQRAVPML